jgi:hypothetical protein
MYKPAQGQLTVVVKGHVTIFNTLFQAIELDPSYSIGIVICNMLLYVDFTFGHFHVEVQCTVINPEGTSKAPRRNSKASFFFDLAYGALSVTFAVFDGSFRESP